MNTWNQAISTCFAVYKYRFILVSSIWHQEYIRHYCQTTKYCNGENKAMCSIEKLRYYFVNFFRQMMQIRANMVKYVMNLEMKVNSKCIVINNILMNGIKITKNNCKVSICHRKFFGPM